MSDEDAYMALALHKAQGELHPLAVGLRALHSGLSAREYVRRVGIPENAFGTRVKAARMADAVTDIGDTDHWPQLAEIHAAPQWLWQALVTALVEQRWRRGKRA